MSSLALLLYYVHVPLLEISIETQGEYILLSFSVRTAQSALQELD